MSERPSDEEREAMIAGERTGALDADEAADLASLADLLADPSTWAEPAPGLEDAVVRAVVDAPAVVAAVAPLPSGVRAHTSRRRRVVLSALGAAAVVIALVVGVVIATRSGTSPDYSGQLTATALAPRAHGSAEVTRTPAGFRITLDARGLPRLASGEYYQAWLKNAQGILVPVGTFSSSDATVTLWSGVSPHAFPTITVTVEPADNDQSSSGRRVLVGEVRAR